MTYAIDSVDLLLQPTSGNWRERKIIGIDGENRAIYEPKYSFAIGWDAMTPAQIFQLWTFWSGVSSAGFVVATLPKYNSSTYSFQAYVNCVIDEPKRGDFFAKHILRIEATIRNITVS